MKKNSLLFGILVMVLVFGMTVVGCNLDNDNNTEIDTGTFQVKFTGISNSDMTVIKNLGFACFLDKSGKTIAGANNSQHSYETGGNDDNQWITFFLYGVTYSYLSDGSYSFNSSIYKGTSGKYDIDFAVFESDPPYTAVLYKSWKNVNIEVNTLNVIDF